MGELSLRRIGQKILEIIQNNTIATITGGSSMAYSYNLANFGSGYAGFAFCIYDTSGNLMAIIANANLPISSSSPTWVYVGDNYYVSFWGNSDHSYFYIRNGYGQFIGKIVIVPATIFN